MNFELLETERLHLRAITPEVYVHVFENFSEAEIKSFFALTSEGQFEKEWFKYKKGLATFNKTFLYFQLILKSSQTIIGWCGFHTWYLDHFRAELGYGLAKAEHKGKGFMTEATAPVLEYGFHKMGLNRIEAFVGKDNLPSLQLLKKFRFVQEGLIRQHYYNKNGSFEDSLLFSLLKEEHESLFQF